MSVVPEWCAESGSDRTAVALRVPAASVVTGVGSSVIAVRRSGPPDPCAPLPFVSEVVGVGWSRCGCQDCCASSQLRNSLGMIPWLISTACSKDGAERRYEVTAACLLVLLLVARGVGNDEEASATVGSAGVGSSNNSPRRVVPHFGKVSEDGVEAVSKVSCDVLQQDA